MVFAPLEVGMAAGGLPFEPTENTANVGIVARFA
jgi:hypothetical protein